MIYDWYVIAFTVCLCTTLAKFARFTYVDNSPDKALSGQWVLYHKEGVWRLGITG